MKGMALRAIPFSLVAGAGRQPMQRATGFTFVELVMIISIIAILAVFAASRMGGGYANSAKYYQQLMAQITYARKVAVAQRRAVCVHIASGQSQVKYDNGAGTDCPAGSAGVLSPTGQAGFLITAPSGTTSTAATIMFDATGRYLTAAGATPGAALGLTVTGEGTYSLTIEPETGYVHP
jgi:MSHA pilin protein MshC